jgi:ATP-binding cassette subfamily B protein
LAKWIALLAAIATGVLYVALLFLLSLFADLMVNRGRIPTFSALSRYDRDAFQERWAALPADERSADIEDIGVDPKILVEMPSADFPTALPPAEAELIWRSQVYQALRHRVSPTAAALVLPEFAELPVRAQKAFLQDWQNITVRNRKERLEFLGKDASPQLATADPFQLTPDQQQLLWRLRLRTLLDNKFNASVADAYWTDRVQRQTRAAGEQTSDMPLADRGVLRLIVRGGDSLPDRVSSAGLGRLARWLPWMWQPGDGDHANFLHYLLGLFVAAAVLALVRALAMFITDYAAALATIEASNRLRRAVYHHTFRLGTLAFRALGPSEAVGIFTRQLEAVHDALYTWLTVVFREPVKFCLLLAFALALNVWLALAFLIFALLVWLIGGQVAAYYRREERAATRRAGEQLAMLQESLMLMRVVKGYLMELFNQSRVERQLSSYAEAQLRRYRGEAIYRPLLVFLGTLAATVLLYVAGRIVLSGRLGVPRAITLATALVSMYWPLASWLEHRRFLRRGRSAALILFKFLDRPGEIGQVVGAEFLPPLGDRLEFDNVSLREPGTGRTLLQEITLTIEAGQRIALVGPEEMEKHALIYLIPRLLDPDSGEIRIDQHNLRWVTFDSLRAQIAFVLQHNLVFNDTVANNIGCGDPSYDLPKIIEAAKVAHAHHFIQKLPKGYETPIGELGHYLNVGEQFRIALARAILRDPALLIVEEPAIVLDDDTKALLDDTFSRVLPGRTIIFLPHRISTIRSCDRIYLLNKGRIEASGEHRDLLTQSELYRHLQYLEFNVFADQTVTKGA